MLKVELLIQVLKTVIIQ